MLVNSPPFPPRLADALASRSSELRISPRSLTRYRRGQYPRSIQMLIDHPDLLEALVAESQDRIVRATL